MQIKGLSDSMRIDDGRVAVRGGGGCMLIVGIPLMLIGCAPIVGLIFGALSGGGIPEYLFVALLSLFFLVFGAVLTFGRYGLDIDGKSRTYRKRFSVLVTLKETTGSLDKFEKVSVRQRVRERPSGEHGSRTSTDYPVRLEGPSETLEIAAPDSMENARRDAERVAKALGLPLADRTGPEEIVRDADHLDESLRERRRRTGEGPGELPPPPEGTKTQSRIEGEEIVLGFFLAVDINGFIEGGNLAGIWMMILFIPSLLILLVLAAVHSFTKRSTTDVLVDSRVEIGKRGNESCSGDN